MVTFIYDDMLPCFKQESNWKLTQRFMIDSEVVFSMSTVECLEGKVKKSWRDKSFDLLNF